MRPGWLPLVTMLTALSCAAPLPARPPDQRPSVARATVAPAKPTPPPPTATPEPAEPTVFEGKGAKVTPEFVVHKGLLLFNLESDGGQFTVKMFDKAASKNPSNVIESSKAFKGSIAWSVSDTALFHMEPGTYTLGIEATGIWKVAVTQPQIDHGLAAPVSFHGTGTQVTEPFVLSGGPRAFQFTATTRGSLSNFIVRLIKADGSKEESIANELPTSRKPAAGSKIVGIRATEAGAYVLSVRGDTEWSITVE